MMRSLHYASPLLAIWSILSSLSQYPSSLSYFNESVGGPQYGHRHLLGSNLDWGQDLLLLQRWKHVNAPNEPIFVLVESFFDLNDMGINSIDMRLPLAQEDMHNHLAKPEGWWAIGAARAVRYGLLDIPGEHPRAEDGINAFPVSILRGRAPVARIGYSIYLFQVLDDEIPNGE